MQEEYSLELIQYQWLLLEDIFWINVSKQLNVNIKCNYTITINNINNKHTPALFIPTSTSNGIRIGCYVQLSRSVPQENSHSRNFLPTLFRRIWQFNIRTIARPVFSNGPYWARQVYYQNVAFVCTELS